MHKQDQQAYELLERDSVNELYGNMLSGIFITALAYFAIVIFASADAPKFLKNGLMLSMGLCLTLRLFDYFYWRKQPPNVINAQSYKTRFKVLNIVTGILWAVAACSLFQYQNNELRYFTLLTLGSMTGGAVNVLAASRLLATCYPLLLIFPLSTMSFFSGVESLTIVGVLGFGYGIIMLSVSRRAATNYRESQIIKNQQISLRSQIESEKNSLKQANEALNRAKEQLGQSNLELETKVRERTAEIHRLSNLDPLTKLLNRNAFKEILLRRFQSEPEQALSIIFIDLRSFKNINDSMGHQLGDKVLQEIAMRLSLTAGSDQVCRWGGDEFVIFYEHQDVFTTQAFAQQILERISKPIITEGNYLKVGGAVGIALFPAHDRNPDSLLEKADIAMYKSKKDSMQDIVFFNDKIREELLAEELILSGLKSAIVKQDFELVYQPILHCHDKSLWGVEALIRWRNQISEVSPEIFIPLAERTGLIVEMGVWIVNQACKQASHWKYISDCHISVNVSAVQLANSDFYSVVKNAIKANKISANKLHIEITETSFSENTDDLLSTIEKIRGLGVKVAIDDFGTGYSSLHQLMKLPADIIKIDKVFISDIGNHDDVIVKAAKMISKQYSFLTVAEGVETESQYEHLKQLDVELVQGFLFSKPLPPAELDLWYKHEYKNKVH